MENPRVIAKTSIEGTFGFPIGIQFLGKGIFPMPRKVEVSTVCLEGAHLEDPLQKPDGSGSRIFEPEHGYETMVFLDGCSFFSLFTQKYKTRRQARDGHRQVVKKILKGTLSLAIPLSHYSAWGEVKQVA